MTFEDSQLIEMILSGDKERFGELVARYEDRLFRTLVHLLGSTHDARDVAQDAFLNAFTKLDTFRKESSFYSWLFRIAYNVAVTQRRKGRRDVHSIDQFRETNGIDPTDNSPTSDPTARLQSLEDQEVIQAAINALGVEYRDVLVMKEIEGLKYEEIAAVLGCPIGTVRSRIHRARQELREIVIREIDPQ